MSYCKLRVARRNILNIVIICILTTSQPLCLQDAPTCTLLSSWSITKGKNGELMSGKKTRDNPRKSLNRPVTNLGKSASVFRTILLLKCSEKAVILFENTQKSRKTNPFLLKSTFFYFWKLPLFSDSKTYKKLKLIPT